MSRDRALSVATVLLALAGGVVLGGGPLQAGGSRSSVEAAEAAAPADVGSQVTALEQARVLDDAYVRATAPAVLRGRLAGRTVALVTLPGADPERVAAVTDLVGVAGGAVTVRAQMRPALLDVGNRQLVAELARQMQEAAPQPVGASGRARGYELAGRLIGHAVADRKDAGAPGDRTGESILAGLETADLLTATEPVTRRGSLVLLVAGPPQGTADQRQGAGSIVSALVDGLEAGSDGVVLAGPSAAASPDGLVGTLRADPAAKAVSTVDALDSVSGAVVAVRALAARARGSIGHYGGSHASDGVLPGS